MTRPRVADARGRAPTADRDPGQATVELALALPVVVVVLLGVVQVVDVVAGRLAVELAAREAARAAAVAADPAAAAAAAARAAVPFGPLDVVTSAGDEQVTVTVTYVHPTDVAVVGRVLGPVELRAQVTMAREPP